MNKILAVIFCVCSISGISVADTFAEGTPNEFTIDFVSISGDSGDLGSWPAGQGGYIFSGVNHGDYRMGIYEITNDQWTKFKNEYGTVYGNPTSAYDENPYWMGTNEPTNYVSWYEATQFVNWLNTSQGYHAAYKFGGTQGTSNYTFSVWDVTDTGYNPNNPFRNSNAYYFLPTGDEWVKAAYWNGTSLQTYATVGDVAPTQDGWNFYDNGYATASHGPWDVGSGTEELNGTYDMMGNVWELIENPYYLGDYSPESNRSTRAGSYVNTYYLLRSSDRSNVTPYYEIGPRGFRVASIPSTCPLADLTGDCFVNLRDLAVLAAAWMSNDTPTANWNPDSDLDGSGNIGIGDLLKFSENWLAGTAKNISGHVTEIEISTEYSFEPLSSPSDPSHNLELYVITDNKVDRIEFLTAGGNLFEITNSPYTYITLPDGTIETSMAYDDQEDVYEWQYEANFQNEASLDDYGEGNYVFTVYYKNGGSAQTSAWFGIPGTSNYIADITQKPIFTNFNDGDTLTSPVNFTWEALTESASGIHLDLDNTVTGQEIENAYPISATGVDTPIELAPSSWTAYLIFVDLYESYNIDGIFIRAAKASGCTYSFTIE